MYNCRIKQAGVSLIALMVLIAGCGPGDTPEVVIATPTADPADTASTWFKTYGSSQDDVGWDIMMAEDGGYFIVGTTNLQFEPEQRGDMLLIRTDSAGRVQWSQTYGGEGYEEGMGIHITDDGRIFVAGVTASFGAGGMDSYLVEVDQEGNELWSTTFGGPLDDNMLAWPMEGGGFLLGGNLVDPNDIVADPGAAGYGGFAGRSNIYLARVDDDGDEVWSQTLGGEDNVLALGATQTADGGFVIVGTVLYYPDSGDDIVLIKVDQDGNEVWSRIWEEGSMFAHDLIETSDGGFLITGAYRPAEDAVASSPDFFLIKTDADGNQIWMQVFGDPEIVEYGTMLVEAVDGGYIAVGETGRSLYEWSSDILLIKFDADGEQVWQEIVETDTHNMFGSAFSHPDGGLVAVGSTYQNDQFDIFMLRADSTGQLER